MVIMHSSYGRTFIVYKIYDIGRKRFRVQVPIDSLLYCNLKKKTKFIIYLIKNWSYWTREVLN